MKVLWIGVGIGPLMLEELKKKNARLLSGYVSQQNLIEGIDTLNIDMDSINSMQFRNIIRDVKREEWSRNGKSRDISIAYKNIKYLNLLIRKKELKKEAKKWAIENRNQEDVVVIVYSLHTPFLTAALEVKKIIPSAKICTIVLDLPQYMDLSMNPVKKALKSFDWLSIKHCMKEINEYVLYTKTMADFLEIEKGKWIVMEGSYDHKLMPDEVQKDNNVISIMYSGILDLHYGIPELLDAMSLLDENYELWITGNNGNAVELIKKRAEQDNRIKYYGFLPSRQDLINKQAEATMLISPRKDLEEGSKYCFPSKIFEYMVSGNPVISCRLDGIPDEYFDYLIELPEVSSVSISDTIKRVGNIPVSERKELGEKGKQFVVTQKNKYVQAEKVIDFITEKKQRDNL